MIKGSGPMIIRDLDFDHLPDLSINAESKVYFPTILGPQIVEADIPPLGVFQEVELFVEGGGYHVFPPGSDPLGYLTSVIEVVLGFFEDGPGDIPVPRTDRKDHVEVLEDLQPGFDGLGVLLQVPREAGVGCWGTHIAPQQGDQGIYAPDIADIGQVDEILPEDHIQMGFLPAGVIAVCALEEGLGKAADP
jgi:hypothetical protein